MSIWSRVRQLVRRARGLRPLARHLISGLSRTGAGSAVTPTRPVGPIAKFTVRFTYRDPKKGTGSAEVLEISPPPKLLGDLGELGRWIRDTFYGGRGFVRVVGAQRRAVEPPMEPRLSLPRALPKLSKDPFTGALRSIRELPAGGRLWYGLLTLDLDDVKPNARSVTAWAKRVGMRRAFEYRRSSGGQGTHVRFSIREGVTAQPAMALRLALGDDPIRTAIDASRFRFHGRSALRGVLFDQKDDAHVGPWRKLKR